MAETKFKLKLTIDNHRKRVLFAEAEKDCVDFLFSILSLPVSNLILLLGKDDKMLVALPNLYDSVETLAETLFQPNVTKDSLLKLPPAAPLLAGYSDATAAGKASSIKELYGCSKVGHRYVSEDPRAVCPSCRSVMGLNVSYVVVGPSASQCGGGGIVKEGLYMVMDDLVVKPMSTVSFLALLIQFEIKNVCTLEEKVVHVGMNEVIKLLKASFVSKNVLTSVFFNDVSGKKEQT